MGIREFTGELDPAPIKVREFTGELDPVEGQQPLPADVTPSTVLGGRGAQGGMSLADARSIPVPRTRGGLAGEGAAPYVASGDVPSAGPVEGLAPVGDQGPRLSMRQAGRDLLGGVEQVKGLVTGAAAFGSSLNWKNASDALADMDAVDSGGAPQARMGGVNALARPSDMAGMYAAADPATRAKLRDTATKRLMSSQEFIQRSVQAIKAYSEEAKKQFGGGLPEFTDVRSVQDFGVWAVRNGTATSPTMAASMLSAVVGGVPGLMASSIGMALGDMTSARAEAAPQGQEAAYLAKNAGTTGVLALPYAALDLLGPAGTVARQGVKGLASPSIKGAAKDLAKQIGAEALNEGGQEVINIGSDIAAQERPAEVMPGDASRVINAAAVGGVMGAGGHAANVGAAAARDTINSPERQIAKAIDSVSFKPQQFGPDGKPLRPTEQRKQVFDGLDDYAAEHAMPPKLVEAIKKNAETVPLAQLPGFLERSKAALAKRGLWRGPVEPAAPPPSGPAESAAPTDAIDAAELLDDGSGLSEPPQRTAVDDAAHMAATSPTNDLAEPTQGQKEAGNYPKGHPRVGPLRVSVENPAGSVRRGVDEAGNPWETTMQDHYGYIKNTVAYDSTRKKKQGVDLFTVPGTPEDYSGPVFVVDQVNPKTGAFDEHKAIAGASSEAEAEAVYRRNYAADWQGFGGITRLPMPAFDAWVHSKAPSKGALGDLNAADTGGNDRSGPADAGRGDGSPELRQQRPADVAVDAVEPDVQGVGGLAPAGLRPGAAGNEGALTPPVAPGGFDSEAWDKERADRVKASRDAGNVHLDTLPAYVETMRGKSIRYAHDPKVKGRILTVDNLGNVFVEWSDAYSQEKEGAVPMKYGKKTVMQTSLGPSDLKDYYVAATKPNADQPPAKPVAESTKPRQPSEPGDGGVATTQAAGGRPSSVMLPAGLQVTFGGKTYPVESINDAQEKWIAFRDETGEGVSKVGNGIRITDRAGRFVARISYNGRVWDAEDVGDGGKVILEAPGDGITKGRGVTRKFRQAGADAFREGRKRVAPPSLGDSDTGPADWLDGYDEAASAARPVEQNAAAPDQAQPAVSPRLVASPAAAAPSPPVAPNTTEKIPKHLQPRDPYPKTVWGSEMLAGINRQLGGISKELWHDLSFKKELGLKDKNGKPRTAWFNPSGGNKIGGLFRDGGIEDTIELAEWMESEGYITPGTVERDSKEAEELARSLVTKALNRQEPELQVGQEDEWQKRLEAAMGDAPEIDDAAMARGVEAGYDDDTAQERAMADALLSLRADEIAEREAKAVQEFWDSLAEIEAQEEDLAKAQADAEAASRSVDAAAARDAEGQPRQGDSAGAGDRGQAGAEEGLTDVNRRASELIDQYRRLFANGAPSGMTQQEFHDWNDRRAEADDITAQKILALAKTSDEGLLLPQRWGSGFVALHLDPRTPGAWRITRFTDDMTPSGHMEWDRPTQAAAELRDSGVVTNGPDQAPRPRPVESPVSERAAQEMRDSPDTRKAGKTGWRMFDATGEGDGAIMLVSEYRPVRVVFNYEIKSGTEHMNARVRAQAWADTHPETAPVAAEGLTLEAQDEAALKEKTEREAEAKKADASEQARLTREAAKAKEKAELGDRTRQDASADAFELGQSRADVVAAMAGNGDLFAQPAEAQAKPTRSVDTQREVDLKKRIGVLESLRKCLG